MPAERLSMRKVREVLHLKHALGLSYRKISEATGAGKTQAAEYVRRALAAGITWPVPEGIDDAELERRLFPVADEAASKRAAIDWPAMQRELKRRGVTLALCGRSIWPSMRTATATRGASCTGNGASICRRRCGRRMWPARSCSSTGRVTRSESSIRQRARWAMHASSSPHSAHRTSRTPRRAGRRRCPTGSVRTSTRSRRSAACRRRLCRTISRPVSPSRRATSRASIAPTRISPITTAASCCPRGSYGRATRRRSKSPCRSSSASCWRSS